MYKMLEFRKFSEFPRGTLYDILQDAYSYDSRNKELWDENWHESDEFFYDNPEIADNYGLVTCIDNYPIGFVTWDPRNIPEYVEMDIMESEAHIKEKVMDICNYKRQFIGFVLILV